MTLPRWAGGHHSFQVIVLLGDLGREGLHNDLHDQGDDEEECEGYKHEPEYSDNSKECLHTLTIRRENVFHERSAQSCGPIACRNSLVVETSSTLGPRITPRIPEIVNSESQ